MKGSFFETFIPDGKSVVVPVKDFEFIAALVVEDEEGRCKQIGLKGVEKNGNEGRFGIGGRLLGGW